MKTPENFDQLVQQYFDYMSAEPNLCVDLGIDKHLDDLPNPSSDWRAQRIREGQELLMQLEAFPKEEIDDEAKLDLELAQLPLGLYLVRMGMEFNGKSQESQMPKAADAISGGLFTLFINDPRPAGDRLENITNRLKKVPDYLVAHLRDLDTPIARWAEMDLQSCAETPSLFETLINWAETENFAGIEDLKKAASTAAQALSAYQVELRKMPTETKFAIGPEWAQQVLAFRGIPLTFDELRDVAKNFLAENKADTEELRGTLVEKYKLDGNTTTEELQAFLNNEYKVKVSSPTAFGEILDRYRAEQTKLTEFIKQNDLFPMFDDQTLEIVRTPKFMEPMIPAGAMMSPPPFRDGTRKSIVYLTLREELMDEHTEISIPMMMLHEGIPGHHLQLAWASKHPSTIRRFCDAMDQAEGWTTMLEDYMLDIGYGGDLEDEMRFSGKRDIARIGARVAIDLYFMTGDKSFLEVGIDADFSSDDPFVNAGRLLKAVTGFTDARLQAELNWYSQERGYPLSYLTGNHLVWQLKRDMVKKNKGNGFDLDRRFHDTYLKTGSMPVSVARRIFQQKGLID